ncbi:MAG: RidA family protein [Chloroflexi bacterium]|jgi:2-iminobutanoate/2-iminopropanoate deaminase|nr:RidA family protein [Chloroflexota bacterium]
MEREVVATTKAPGAVGPYSQAVCAGDLVYTAGQIALDPATGQMVGDDISTQTDRVLLNLKAILESAGSGLTRVVKTTVYLQDMADFAQMNQVYSRYFASSPPARTTVEVSALPLGALVEIEAVALRYD